MNQSPDDSLVSATLKQIELDSAHPTRKLARELVADYRRRQTTATYDFLQAPRELRQVVYDGIVRYGAQHSWWARLRTKR